MGVQSADTVQVEAAERAKKAKEQNNRETGHAGEDAAKAVQDVEDPAQWFRARSKVAGDVTVAFVRARPAEAMLIACAGGALVMGLLMLASRSD